MAPRDCAARLVQESAHGVAAVVFGPEKSGLTNEDLDRCNTLLTIPTEPGFSSLNLAMAVQVLVYELRMAGIATDETLPEPESPPATGTLMRRLRRLFVKAELDQNEVNILRGMLAALDPEEPKDQVE
jgi:tRNA C32,U32 (ribose-2'-O)-methylase TrmJ